jgi:hypothetical protein
MHFSHDLLIQALIKQVFHLDEKCKTKKWLKKERQVKFWKQKKRSFFRKMTAFHMSLQFSAGGAKKIAKKCSCETVIQKYLGLLSSSYFDQGSVFAFSGKKLLSF